jgi:hypothetical protein
MRINEMSWVSSLLYEQIAEYRAKWKINLQRMEQIRIPLQANKHRPTCRRDIKRPRRRWKEA